MSLLQSLAKSCSLGIVKGWRVIQGHVLELNRLVTLGGFFFFLDLLVRLIQLAGFINFNIVLVDFGIVFPLPAVQDVNQKTEHGQALIEFFVLEIIC